MMSGRRFGGSIYNGSDYDLTQVEIDIESLESGSLVKRTYTTPVQIESKTAGDFSFDVISCRQGGEIVDFDQANEFGDPLVLQDVVSGQCDWSVVSAKGTR